VGFRNPPGSPPQTAGLKDFAAFFLRRARDRPPAPPAGHVLPEAEAREGLARAGAESLTWLGHAAFLVRIGGKSILTDPYLTGTAGPLPGVGAKRLVPPGLPVRSLPPIDAVVISHNHYDHLDARTIAALPGRGRIAAILPLGLGPFFRSRGYRDVRELNWQEATALDGVTVTSLPAVHFSGRTPFDRNATLWTGFGFRSGLHNLFFAGDTGHGAVFRETGERHGPFSLAMVPIGAYEPRSIMGPVHCNPEEAVRLGQDIRAATLVAMHWGTVALTDEPLLEPPGRFLAAGTAAGYRDENLWVMKIGETRDLPR
jgi:N-acyl-phosphatidylethanolamine-hydrolysing phospholipase D